MPTVLEYKCPCCGAGLSFGEDTQKLKCAYCDNEFTIEAVQAFNEAAAAAEPEFVWEDREPATWSDSERDVLQFFTCPSCGGEILTEESTAATFCPYCENPTILPGRLSGSIKPDAVLPFRTGKEDAKAAFLQLCSKKRLLPKMFTTEQRLEKITGMYVPFWLYDCGSELNGRYNATRVHCWSDSRYNYTRTEHFLLLRRASAEFTGIPMDGSSKMDNALMESIEPFDYSQLVDFDTAYLSGFLADRYDVEAQVGQERIQQRVSKSMEELVAPSLARFATVVPAQQQINVRHGRAQYVLLPVWMLNTRYKDKTYTFVMNGQTGKMTGSFPICPKRTAAWFSGVCAAVCALATLIQILLF